MLPPFFDAVRIADSKGSQADTVTSGKSCTFSPCSFK
jgi:hypothetical protein